MDWSTKVALGMYLGHWFEIPIGLGLGVLTLWGLHRIQDDFYLLWSVALSAFVVWLPLIRLADRPIPPVVVYLSVIAVIVGLVSVVVEPTAIAIRSGIVVALAGGLLYFIWGFANALVQAL